MFMNPISSPCLLVGGPSMKWSCSRTRQHVRPLWTVSTTQKSKLWTRPRVDEITEFSHILITIATPTVFHSNSWYVILIKTVCESIWNIISDWHTHQEGLLRAILKERRILNLFVKVNVKPQIPQFLSVTVLLRNLLFYDPDPEQNSTELLTTTKSVPTFLAERMANVRHRRQDRRTM